MPEETPGPVDSAAAERVLREAAYRNQSLDLVRLLDGGPDACRSRFVETGGRQVVVALPSRGGHYVPVRPGEKVEVFFRLGTERYYFASAVESRSELQLSAEMSMPVLSLRRPRVMTRRQRRDFFRIRISAADKLVAALRRPPETKKSKVVAAPLPELEVLDLSAGGLRLLYPKREGCPVDEGQALIAAVALEPGGELVALAARVKHVTRLPRGPTHIGLEFVGLDDSVEGRLLRSRLLRFVAQRQREELRRMRS